MVMPAAGPPRMVVITGGARGIGYAVAEQAVAEGRPVMILDRDRAALDEAVGRLRDVGGDVLGFEVDVSIAAGDGSVADWIETIERPRLGYLFANAGTAIRDRVAAADVSREDWHRIFDSHVLGVINACRAVLPILASNGFGRVVISSSDYAVVGMRRGAHYAAAKSALWALTKCLATEYAQHNITVNAVGAGPIDTELLRYGHDEQQWSSLMEIFRERVPMGRLGKPDEVAKVVNFFFDERSGYITGQMIHPNGGQVMY